MGSNPAPITFFFSLFFLLFYLFLHLRWVLVNSNPLHLHSPLFMILIVPNVLTKPLFAFINSFHSWFTSPIPQHHPPTPNLATPTSPTPPSFFFEFSQKLYFSVHIRPDPQPDPPPDPTPPPPPTHPQFFFFFFEFSQKLQSSIPIHPDPLPPTKPEPPPP